MLADQYEMIFCGENYHSTVSDIVATPDVLQEISDYHHVAIMLSPQSMSVDRFFDRDDPEKCFFYGCQTG